MLEKITQDSFDEVVESNNLVVVAFTATWCGPCRHFEIIFNSIAQKYPEVMWGKVDIDVNPSLVTDFNITKIPHIMLIKRKIIAYSLGESLSAVELEDLLLKAKALDLTEVKFNDEEC